MPSALTKGSSEKQQNISRERSKRTSKLHSVLVEAKRIRKDHLEGLLTAEEAAEKLAGLYNKNRFKANRSTKSLLSA